MQYNERHLFLVRNVSAKIVHLSRASCVMCSQSLSSLNCRWTCNNAVKITNVQYRTEKDTMESPWNLSQTNVHFYFTVESLCDTHRNIWIIKTKNNIFFFFKCEIYNLQKNALGTYLILKNGNENLCLTITIML